MTVLNYTTKIPATKTIGEVQELLAKHGANRISVDYEDGRPAGLTFVLPTPHGLRFFTLPVDVTAMHRLLLAEDDAGRLRSSGMSAANRRSIEHAERVAWRVIKDWLAAQLALVATRMATIDQVMLPYLHTNADGVTLYAAYREREEKALSAPAGPLALT